MAKNPNRAAGGGGTSQTGVGSPPERPTSEPIRDLHPTMDARFVLVEIGQLMARTESHTKALDKLADKVSALDDTVKSAKLIGKVLSVAVGLLAAALIWLVSFLWPFREKLLVMFGGQ